MKIKLTAVFIFLCMILIIFNSPSFTKVFATVVGTVKSENGKPIPGAKVILISGVHNFWKNNVRIVENGKKKTLKKKDFIKRGIARNNNLIYGYEKFKNCHNFIFRFIDYNCTSLKGAFCRGIQYSIGLPCIGY